MAPPPAPSDYAAFRCSDNNLQLQGAEALAPSLARLTCLESLRLRWVSPPRIACGLRACGHVLRFSQYERSVHRPILRPAIQWPPATDPDRGGTNNVCAQRVPLTPWMGNDGERMAAVSSGGDRGGNSEMVVVAAHCQPPPLLLLQSPPPPPPPLRPMPGAAAESESAPAALAHTIRKYV